MGTAFVFARARAGYEKALKGELKGIKNVSEVYLIKPDRGEPYDVMAKFHVSSKFEFDKIIGLSISTAAIVSLYNELMGPLSGDMEAYQSNNLQDSLLIY